jgi:glycosyltransferase involved in cell wall biosynthesis
MAVLRHARDCDLIYINENLALLVALAGRILGKPMVLRIMCDGTWEISHRLGWHQDTITEYVKKKYGFKVWFIRKLMLLWYSWVKYIVAPSRFLEKIALGYGVPPQKLRQINNAYHGPEEISLSREEARKGLGIDHEEKMILTICRLMIWKGVDGIIRALRDLPEDHKLYVVGDGDELENWSNLAREFKVEDRVFFKGNVPYDKIPFYLKAADVFVLNSQYEGLSHTLLEVMWMGLPAVVTGVCGNPELIEDGYNGFTVSFNNADAIRDRVKKILNDPDLAALFVQRSKKKAESFTREKTFKEKEELFKQAAGVS